MAGRRALAPGLFFTVPHPALTVPAARRLAWCARTVLLLAALGTLAAVPAWAQPATGRLPRHVEPLRYDVRLTVDPAVETFAGTADIAVRLREATDTIELNARALEVLSARASLAGVTEEATVTAVNDDVIALRFASPLAAGEATLTLAWRARMDSGGGTGLFRQQEGGRWYAVTQFEPMDARRVLPCFDEPDRKAVWRLTLVVPATLRAFANMPVDSERQPEHGLVVELRRQHVRGARPRHPGSGQRAGGQRAVRMRGVRRRQRVDDRRQSWAMRIGGRRERRHANQEREQLDLPTLRH